MRHLRPGRAWIGRVASIPPAPLPPVAVAMAHVLGGSHHGGRAISIAAISHWVAAGWALHGREGAAEACCTTLEVGEATRGAVPVTGAGAVLARREGAQDVGSTVEHTARRRRNLDSLLVQSTSVHAEALSSLRQVSCMQWHSGDVRLPLHGKKRWQSPSQWACADQEYVGSRRQSGDRRTG